MYLRMQTSGLTKPHKHRPGKRALIDSKNNEQQSIIHNRDQTGKELIRKLWVQSSGNQEVFGNEVFKARQNIITRTMIDSVTPNVVTAEVKKI